MDIRVQTVIKLFSSNLAKSLTLEQMAAHVHLSTSRLRHLFEEETGKTPARYLRSVRMGEARRLLATTFLSPKEIMFKVGIANQSQFIRDFRQDSNMTPTQFRVIVRNLAQDHTGNQLNGGGLTPEAIETVVNGTGNLSGLSGAPKPKLGTGNELKHSDELFFAAFNGYPQPMAITNLETGRFLYVNDCYLANFGYSRERLIGHTSLELGIWLSPAARIHMLEILNERGQINQLELELKISSGAIRVVLYSAKVLEIEGKRSILSLTHDITDHKLAYDRLLLEKQKLEEQVSQLSGKRAVSRR